MKKISIILAAASLLVVGGVYAGWSYSQGTVTSVNDDIGAIMTSESIGSSKGTLSVETGSTKFEIDDITGDAAYLPVLVVKTAPTVTFTPSVGADKAVIDDGVSLQWSISIDGGADGWKYDSTFSNATPDKDIFTVSSSKYDIPDSAKVKNADGSFTYTISTDSLLTAVKLTLQEENVLLDTKAKYDAFKDDLMSGDHFVLLIEEKI